MLFAVLTFAFAAAIVGLPALMPRGTQSLVSDRSPTAGLPATSPTAEVAVATGAVTFPPRVSANPWPTVAVRTFPAPFSTSGITPDATTQPTPSATLAPTAQPTPRPTPTPPPETVTLSIDDGVFVGDYDLSRSVRYRGHTVSWVYGQGTQWHTMTATFRLPRGGEILQRASLTLVGLDGEDPGKSRISVALNGTVVYRGPNPLPNDSCCDDTDDGSWGSATFKVAGRLLRRENTLTVTNLDPSDCTRCPTYVMLDYAELTYRVRPRP